MTDGTRWDGTERRSNLRLRTLIDELRSELRDTRQSLEFLRERVSSMAVELERLKQESQGSSPSSRNRSS
jgi:hypothetical protein